MHTPRLLRLLPPAALQGPLCAIGAQQGGRRCALGPRAARAAPGRGAGAAAAPAAPGALGQDAIHLPRAAGPKHAGGWAGVYSVICSVRLCICCVCVGCTVFFFGGGGVYEFVCRRVAPVGRLERCAGWSGGASVTCQTLFVAMGGAPTSHCVCSIPPPPPPKAASFPLLSTNANAAVAPAARTPLSPAGHGADAAPRHQPLR